jgi:hypothetical protein
VIGGGPLGLSQLPFSSAWGFMGMFKGKLWGLLVAIWAAGSIHAEMPENWIRDYSTIRDGFGLTKYDNYSYDKMALATIDSSFGSSKDPSETLQDYVRRFLPKNDTTVISYYNDDSLCSETPPKPGVDILTESQRKDRPNPDISHGLWMDQVVYALFALKSGPRYFLFNGNGNDNFVNACKCIARLGKELKIRMVLHAQNFETGNFDGSQYLNPYVDKVVDSNPEQPILWVNAVGNNHNRVKNAYAKFDANGFVLYDKDASGNPLNYFEISNFSANNPIKLVASWNDFGPNQGGKDLDLFLTDDKGAPVKAFETTSRGEQREMGIFEQTKEDIKKLPVDQRLYKTTLPREWIFTTLKNSPSTYRVYVRAKNPQAFDPTKDRVRVTIVGQNDFLQMVSPSGKEEVMTPGDNARVITVGARHSASSLGPTWDGRTKPDFITDDANFAFTDRTLPVLNQSSPAAASVAARIFHMLGAAPWLTQAQIMNTALTTMPYILLEEPEMEPVFEKNLDWGIKRFPKVFATLLHYFPKADLTFGQYEKSKRFLIGVRGDLARLQSVFDVGAFNQNGVKDRKPRWDKDAFYLEEGAKGVTPYKIAKTIENGIFEPAPWTWLSNRQKNDKNFVEFRRTYPRVEGKTHPVRIFRLPDPSKLPPAPEGWKGE